MRIFFETLSQEAVKRWHVEREKDRERKGIPGYECGILSRSASFSYVSTGCYLSPSLLRWYFSLSPQRKWEPVWHRRPSEESFFVCARRKRKEKCDKVYIVLRERRRVLSWPMRIVGSILLWVRHIGGTTLSYSLIFLSTSLSLCLSLSLPHTYTFTQLAFM